MYRLRRFSQALGRHLLHALAHVGFGEWVLPGACTACASRTARVVRRAAALDAPPPGHPERLVADRAPSEVERALWLDLGWIPDRS